jgi:hypothetical protein
MKNNQLFDRIRTHCKVSIFQSVIRIESNVQQTTIEIAIDQLHTRRAVFCFSPSQ